MAEEQDVVSLFDNLSKASAAHSLTEDDIRRSRDHFASEPHKHRWVSAYEGNIIFCCDCMEVGYVREGFLDG